MRAKRLTVNSSSVAYVSFDFQFVESILGNTTPKGTNTPIQQNADKTDIVLCNRVQMDTHTD